MDVKGVVGASLPKWFRVEDQLPETYGAYIICTSRGYIRIAEFEGQRAASFAVHPVYGRVTHWMPIPKPPKAGE